MKRIENREILTSSEGSRNGEPIGFGKFAMIEEESIYESEL